MPRELVDFSMCVVSRNIIFMRLAPVLRPLVVWTQKHCLLSVDYLLVQLYSCLFSSSYFSSFFPFWYCFGERSSWRLMFSFRWQKSNGNCVWRPMFSIRWHKGIAECPSSIGYFTLDKRARQTESLINKLKTLSWLMFPSIWVSVSKVSPACIQKTNSKQIWS